jgi:NAD(P)H-hydrate epimerase
MAISVQEMRELEKKSGISSAVLMQRAGEGIFNILDKKFDLKNKNILIVCYHGKNGGDGFVAAHYLSQLSEVDVLFIGDESKMSEETLINYKKILKNDKIQFFEIDDIIFEDYDIIIDAMLGTGFKGELRDTINNVIKNVNNTKAFKVAVDVPTGINPDTGEKKKDSINADIIIALHDIKKGLMNLKDKTIIVDIGL